MFFLPTINMVETGVRIKKLRVANGYTISRLADVLGVTQQAVCKWQNGQSVPSIDHCVELSDLFQVRIDDIIAVNQPMRSKDLFVRDDERSSFFAQKPGRVPWFYSICS